MSNTFFQGGAKNFLGGASLRCVPPGYGGVLSNKYVSCFDTWQQTNIFQLPTKFCLLSPRFSYFGCFSVFCTFSKTCIYSSQIVETRKI